MSAVVEEITLYSAGCSVCCVGIDATGDLDYASDWAANHDAENHAEDREADDCDAQRKGDWDD